MRYLSPSAHRHGQPDRTGLLLLNLGTPSAPTRAAVKAYLAEFLMDPRVVEIPRPLWWLTLHGAVLPLRSSASAARYASIWTPEGSPLLVHSERQMRALMAEMQQRGVAVEVDLAMRYGEPSIGAALERMRQKRVRRLLVLPLYPQYSATTTGSAFDGVAQVLERTRDLPELRWVRGFHDHPGYVRALARSVRAHWSANGRPARLVMSFHGLPRRNLDLGDPYHCECHRTARLLAEDLGLRPEEFLVSFQSRFGRARWLEPYTVDVLRRLGREKAGRVDVLCPGFAADCLETLEEIAREARREFLTSGGREFQAIACLNDSKDFIEALADIAQAHMQGWPVAAQDQAARARDAAQSAALAKAAGASR